ncbi:MAG: hypothetical protein LBM59_07875 [Ruminococcus sp.]|jgi:hypothetical protein|nr:hypothetical protein [Ruminococcus sp.]
MNLDMNNGKSSALVEAGMAHLGELFDVFELQEFIRQIRTNHFDYTEWRRDNLFEGMTHEEFKQHLIEHARTHGKPKIRGPINT